MEKRCKILDTGRKDANIQIGKRLREARLNMNLEKSEIADVLGVTVEHYRKLEAGITGISVDKVLTLYHKYGIDPTYLITGESSMKDFNEYSCVVTPQVRQTGNRLSGLVGTAYASLLA